MAIVQNSLAHTLDDNLQMEDGAAALANTDTGSTILDFGADCVMKGDLYIDVSANVSTNGDEYYTFCFQVSSSATFAGTAARTTGQFTLGNTAEGVHGADVYTTGVYVVPVSNVFGTTPYRYGRIYMKAGGTGSPTVTCKAWLCKRT